MASQIAAQDYLSRLQSAAAARDSAGGATYAAAARVLAAQGVLPNYDGGSGNSSE